MMLWYLARGAGLATLVLLTTATCLGALAARRGRPATRYLLQYVHRACAGLGVATLALHVTTVLADPLGKVGWEAVVVPLTSGYRPLAVALGTLAAYTIVAVAVLGAARGRLARSARAARSWRGVHALAYAGWGAAMLHGFTAGTDASLGWVRLLYLGCLVAVAASVTTRLAELRFARVQGALR